jgi:hypothetical protein
MTTALLLPETSTSGETVFWAVVGNRQFSGRTPGEALDALLQQIPREEQTSILLRQFGPDEFFGEEKRSRLQFLMAKWRVHRDSGNKTETIESWRDAETEELQALTVEEMLASARRAESLVSLKHA